MNRALLFLWFALLRRRLLEFGRGLRRPTVLLGVAAVTGLFGLLFRYRHEQFFAQLLQTPNLVGTAWLAAGASVSKGFWQRGLAFEPADIEFLFTSPFSQSQVVGYRLLPQYLYALAQGVVLAALFAPHLEHPCLAAAGLAFFQALCFHLATAASLFAGTLSLETHHRLRWMLLGAFAFLAALVFRVVWDIRFVPAWVTAPASQLLFYPAVTLPDVATSTTLHRWAAQLIPVTLAGNQNWGRALGCVLGLGFGAGLSLWGLFRLKANLFEAALTTTTQVAERRQRLAQGRDLSAAARQAASSAGLPRLALFAGVGALVWKNLLVARRSRRELTIALLLVTLCAWGIGALSHSVAAQMPAPGDRLAVVAVRGFNLGIGTGVAMLAFLLQRLFPFDFRRDAYHLEAFRTLPASPWWLVLAETAVPIGLVLASQVICLSPLVLFGRVEWSVVSGCLLAYPAIALGVGAVWNVHYVLGARRQGSGEAQSGSAVATLLVVVASFLIFVPAVWVLTDLAAHTGVASRSAEVSGDDPLPLGNLSRGGGGGPAAVALGVQYTVDLALLGLLAWVFGRSEAARREG